MSARPRSASARRSEVTIRSIWIAARLVVLVLSTSLVSGEEKKAQPPAKPPAASEERWAIQGATIHPASRPMIRRGVIVWKGRTIEAVGEQITVSEDAKVIDGNGLHVAPGFVAVSASGLGLERTQGDIGHSLDPYDLELRLALARGITTAQLIDSRSSSGFGSDPAIAAGARSAVIKLTAGELDAMLLEEPALNYFALPTRQVELNRYLLRERFRKAAQYLEQVKEAEARKQRRPDMPRELGPYVTVLRNERPTLISASSEFEVRIALELRDEYGFDLVLDQPDDAWTMATDIATRQIPVLVKSRGRDLNFNYSGSVREEGDMIPVRRPAEFAAAGCTVAILPYRRSVSLAGLAGRDLTALAFDAAFAVRGGLPEEEALRAITLHPARILGVHDRVGSLEEGKDADLLLLDGDPLDYRTQVLRAFINGKVYYDRVSSRLFGGREATGEGEAPAEPP